MNYYDIYLNEVEVEIGVDYLMPWFDCFYFMDEIKTERRTYVFNIKNRLNPFLTKAKTLKSCEYWKSMNKLDYSRKEILDILKFALLGYIDFKVMAIGSGAYLTTTNQIGKIHVCLYSGFYFRKIFHRQERCYVFYGKYQNSLIAPRNYYKELVW